MSQISKRLDQVVKNALLRTPILPVRVKEGILVGDVLIASRHNIKDIYKKGELVYKDVSLNKAAIKIANLLAQRSNTMLADQIYNADQDYGRKYLDSQMLRSQHQKAVKSQQYDRADVLWARYCESRDQAIIAKNLVDKLTFN